MDRSFQSPSLLTQSPFSPRTRPALGAKRGFVPPSFRKSSRFSVSGKSAQSIQIIFKSQYNYVERFGQALPVLVTEALTFAERNVVVSARISECGYAWVVCGRRLLIWQYKIPISNVGTPSKKHITGQCFELQLPQSDLSHRAELVSVFQEAGSNIPTCIAVSPEGVVRYWPAVAHEGVSVEQYIDLQGQECDSLTEVEGLGCILATTTCSVVLVQPFFANGRHNLNCQPLRPPTGWLGGISKRMSSLIFGPISTEHNAETRLVRVVGVPLEQGLWNVYVLAGQTLQKWRLTSHGQDQLIYVAELNRIIRDNFHAALWENCVGDQQEIDTWVLDLQYEKECVILLAAAVNMQVSPQVHYALISLQTSTNIAPTNTRDFKLFKMSGLYREENPAETLSYRFLLSGNCAYLYNQKSVTVFRPMEDPDTLEFNSPQDLLLGGSICVNTPIFFSRNYGLVAISSNDMGMDLSTTNTPLEQSLNDSIAPSNLSIYNLDPKEIFNAYKDTLSQIKAAFIYHVKNQQDACQQILSELFPIEASPHATIDSVLDKIVVLTCTELSDDIPASDPRWTKKSDVNIGSSYSMQILHQLEDKQKAQSLYFKFLKESGLWERLGGYTIRDSASATVHVLGELSEKVVAAINLKSNQNNELLEKAIEKAVQNEEIDTTYGLTNQDVFYKEISKIQTGLQELVNNSEDLAHSDMNPVQVVQIVTKTNEIFLSALKEVLHHRKMNSAIFTPSQISVQLAPDYLPWTTAKGPEGLMDSLWEQHSLTYNYGLKLTNDTQLRGILCDQLVDLIDVILDGRKSHLESIKGTMREELTFKQYCADRHKLIKPLLLEQEWERGAQIAEKYLDFEALVVICEATNNQARLDEYMERFSNDGFSEYVYNWYLKENKQGKLIDRCRKFGGSTNKHTAKLTNFLTDHPALSWMQQIFDKKFVLAADTLKNLSNSEKESLTRQKTMYSLAKLAKLAGPNTSDCNSFINDINSKLELISYQEDVPDYVLQEFGYDSLKPGVISPKDLINLYISSEYADSTEVEFKKALDLLVYIDDEDLREELMYKIWRCAILRDTWDYQNLDSPIELLQNTLFFRIVDLALTLGADCDALLPPIDTLIEDISLENLQTNKNFLYLMKTGYEHIHRSLSA